MAATKRSPSKVLPAEQFPEVVEFMQAQSDLEQFIQEHKDVYDELCRLAATRNDKLEAADKVVRPTGCSVGPFVKLSESKKINAEKLYEEIGADNFGKVGGYTETVVAYKVDRDRFLSMAFSNQIPAEIVEVVVKDAVSYSVIPKYVLP